MIMTKDSHGNYVKIEDIKQQDSFKGISPIDFKSNGDNLKNYRIYGNTVNGESVGDKTNNLLSVLPDGRTDKGITYENKNNLYMQIAGKSTGVYSQTAAKNIFLQAGTYYIRFFCDTAYKQNLFVLLRHSDNKDIVNEFGNGTKFTLENDENIKIIIGVIQSNVEINTDIYVQIAKDIKPSTFEPYGYRMPVTINSNTTSIYLPHQIRKVGDDAEYIDYEEQKQHRVRKNLLQNTATSQEINGVTFTVNSDGSIVCNGQPLSGNADLVNQNFLLSNGTYILTGCPNGGSERETFKILLYINNAWRANDKGSGANFTLTETSTVSVRTTIYAGYTCENLTFYPMIRKADIEDDTYEPYIEDTNVDVTLPALPTLSGTNTLSVNTNIKPSKVWGGLNDPRDILYVKDKLGNILFSKYYEIEDEPPLTYKAKKAGALKDYRIYGNTVNGESVGDRTANLFDGEWTQGSVSNTGNLNNENQKRIKTIVSVIPSQTYTIRTNLSIRMIFAYNDTTEESGIVSKLLDIMNGVEFATITIPDNANLIAVTLMSSDNSNITPSDVEWTMLNTGSTALPYEPYGYKVPVTVSNGTDTLTTPIYLPEQMRKVGDEEEYIDYAEQKMHRVRKNLLQNTATSQTINGVMFTVNSDGSVSYERVRPSSSQSDFYMVGSSSANEEIDLTINTQYIFSGGISSSAPIRIIGFGAPSGWDVRSTPMQHNITSNSGRVILRVMSSEEGSGTFYPMIRKADIEDNTYEPYIENTEVDVTLPALPTLSGTNTLSVETGVPPSDIYLKGKIEKKPKIYYKIYYYSQDGQTLLYTESVLKGSNGMYSGTPTKMADPQYTYTFAGWSSSTGQTTATPEVRNNIQNDKNVYAAFSQTLNTYTVYFYNESDTPIETVQNVPYGGTATYTGATPTKQGYSFTGWSPLPTNITADTSCYAQFEEDDMYESIADTWSQIIANVSNGTYSTKYHIGDTKKIDLGTEGEVIMTIVGIDTDDLADNSGKAPMTWISKQLLKTSHRMNPSYQSGAEGTGSLGGWEKTEMRSYLKETVKPLIPETVRNAIKPVKKYSRIYNVSGSAVNDVLTTEDVWIPSYKELFGLGLEKQGPTYSTVFPDRASHIKSKVGSRAASWWLRSAGDHYTVFNSVGADGGYGENYARNAGGVALGFCT